MKHLLDDVRRAVASENWYAALGLALSLPDLCGQLETPGVPSAERYARWFKQHLEPFYTRTIANDPQLLLSASDCYALRCVFFGHDSIDESARRRLLDRFDLVVSPPAWVVHLHHNGNRLELQVDQLCDEICVAVEVWLATMVDPAVRRRIETLPVIQRPF
ncbi:MAG: hypothetical protein AB7P03_20725 [Kofleriaceae bacterium]